MFENLKILLDNQKLYGHIGILHKSKGRNFMTKRIDKPEVLDALGKDILSISKRLNRKKSSIK